jgi:hypothetical protein
MPGSLASPVALTVDVIETIEHDHENRNQNIASPVPVVN